MTTRAFGQDIRFFFGVVVDRADPLQLGRCRLRILGIHSFNETEVPTASLPWALPISNLNNPPFRSVGTAPLGLIVGSVVLGFFADGPEGQIPCMMGVLPSIPGGVRKDEKGNVDPQSLLSDIPFSARGIPDYLQQPGWKPIAGEPPSYFAASSAYPYNKASRTEGGHVWEVDDTPGKERLLVGHATGTYCEISNDGRKVFKTVGNDFNVVKENRIDYITKNLIIQVGENIVQIANGAIIMNSNSAIAFTAKGPMMMASQDSITMVAPKININ